MALNQNLKWPAQTNNWSKGFELFCKTVFRYYCGLSVFGLDNLPKKPFLICSNHSSHIDSALLMVAAKLPFSQTGLIAAKDYFFDQADKGYLQHLMNLVPIERKSGPKGLIESINICKKFLQHNSKALIIYPEGTRSNTGKISKFKEGAIIMAHELQIPIVPAYIHNANKALPKGCYIIRPTNISVSFGPPMTIEDKEDRKELFASYKIAALNLQNAVEKLRDELPYAKK